jgi:hypothetical protein
MANDEGNADEVFTGFAHQHWTCSDVQPLSKSPCGSLSNGPRSKADAPDLGAIKPQEPNVTGPREKGHWWEIECNRDAHLTPLLHAEGAPYFEVQVNPNRPFPLRAGLSHRSSVLVDQGYVEDLRSVGLVPGHVDDHGERGGSPHRRSLVPSPTIDEELSISNLRVVAKENGHSHAVTNVWFP